MNPKTPFLLYISNTDIVEIVHTPMGGKLLLRIVQYPGRVRDFFALSFFLTWKVSNMAAGRVLVYGGKGALGATCVSYFKSKNWVSRVLSFSIFHMTIFLEMPKIRTKFVLNMLTICKIKLMLDAWAHIFFCKIQYKHQVNSTLYNKCKLIAGIFSS